MVAIDRLLLLEMEEQDLWNTVLMEPIFNLPLYDGSGVVNWIQARNSFVGVPTPVTQNAGGGGAFTGAVSCP